MDLAIDVAAEERRLNADKPYVELIDGIEVRKAETVTRHSFVQMELALRLRAWAGNGGFVGAEWRCWLLGRTERPTSLVPDVAYFARERLADLNDDAFERPQFAPDAVVEVRSPDDRERNIARKIELYLAHGARVVFDIDPKRWTVVAHDSDAVRRFAGDDVVTHVALPGFALGLAELRAAADPRRVRRS